MIIFFFYPPPSLERMNEQDGSESLTVQRWTSRIAKMAQPDLDFIGKSCASLLIHFPMTIKVSRLKRWTHIASLLPRTDGFVERIITDQYIWFYFFFFNFLRKCCMKTSALATHKRLSTFYAPLFIDWWLCLTLFSVSTPHSTGSSNTIDCLCCQRHVLSRPGGGGYFQPGSAFDPSQSQQS